MHAQLAAAAEAARVTTTPAQRAAWCNAIADALDAAADELVPLAARETHLPAEPRLRGELGRTTFQLRLFGAELCEGGFLRATIDHEGAAWPMGARPDIRRCVLPIGPVLVFAASNFPFAFSVAGGDTASALAAGCPVVVKAHPGHPRLSDRTAEIVTATLARSGAPDGMFGLIHGVDDGVAALRDPRIAAAAFTGSVPGGRALFDIAAARPDPIPFYGELGSINPVYVTPGAVAERGTEIADGFVGSFTLGAGQFCTKPGLLFLPAGHGLTEHLVTAVKSVAAQQLLNTRIATGYARALTELPATPLVTGDSDGDIGVTPSLWRVDAAEFGPGHQVERFGPSSLLVEYTDPTELPALAAAVEPSLTATVHATRADDDLVGAITGAARAGRLVYNGWPTGVTVSYAQHHGDPYPATTAPTTTSVGTAAIERFGRPVAWQGFPAQLLPEPLRDDNPWQIPQRVDGARR